MRLYVARFSFQRGLKLDWHRYSRLGVSFIGCSLATIFVHILTRQFVGGKGRDNWVVSLAFATRAGVHVAMTAGLIALAADIDLERLQPRVMQRQPMLR